MPKLALVTGAGRGLGAALSERLAGSGYHVILNVRKVGESESALLGRIRDAGGTAEFWVCDIDDGRSVEGCLSALGGRRLDALVNNAGRSEDDLLNAFDSERFGGLVRTNFTSARRLTLGLLPSIKKGSGVVLNIGSIAGCKPRKGQGPYAVAKAMLIAWTEAMARLEGEYNFLVLSPGPVATEMIRASAWYSLPGATSRIPMGRFASPEEIAEYGFFLIENPNIFRNGSNHVVDGGFLNTTAG